MEGRVVGTDPREWRGHFLVCGWNPGAAAVVQQLVLVESQVPVALVNVLPVETMTSTIDQLREELARGVSTGGAAPSLIVHVPGDPADDAVLEAVGAGHARAAIMVADEVGGPASGADDRTLRQTLAVRDANSEAQIVAEVLRPGSAQYVRDAGANEVFVRDANLPFYLVAATRSPGLGAAARRLFGAGSAQAVRREPIPEDLRGRSLADVRRYFRRQQGHLVIGIISDPEQLTVGELLGSGTGWVDQFIQRMLAESGQDVLAEARGSRQVRINPPDDYLIGPRDFAIVVPSIRRPTASTP